MQPIKQTKKPKKNWSLSCPLGKPTRKMIPIKPRTKPAKPKRSILSIFINRPMTEENNGIAPTKIAVKAVPIRGTASDNPISCIETEVKPNTAKCFIPIEKSNLLLMINASRATLTLAIKDLTLIAAAQSKASTTLSSNKNETPQRSESIENLVVISAFI